MSDSDLMSQQHTACEPCGGTSLYHCPGHDEDFPTDDVAAIESVAQDVGPEVPLSPFQLEFHTPNGDYTQMIYARNTIDALRVALGTLERVAEWDGSPDTVRIEEVEIWT